MMMMIYFMRKFLLLQCLSNGNTLLLSKSGHGRKDLVFLTSFAAGCKVSFTITCLFIYYMKIQLICFSIVCKPVS